MTPPLTHNKQTLEQLQQAVERATQALEELEAALDAGDNRTVGARLADLRRVLVHAVALCGKGGKP